MRPMKASLLLVYCLAGAAAVGTLFSHFWQVNKLLLEEKTYAVRPAAPVGAAAQESESAPEEPMAEPPTEAPPPAEEAPLAEPPDDAHRP